MQMEFVGGEMKVSEIIKTAIMSSDKQQKEVADGMGWSQQALSNRLRNNSIDAEEWVAISRILGYELKMVAKDGSSVKPKVKGVYPRAQQIVGGYMYDTEKGTAICRTPKMAGASFELYRDIPTKQHYIVIYCDWGTQREIVTPITEQEARDFYKACGGADEESVFN